MKSKSTNLKELKQLFNDFSKKHDAVIDNIYQDYKKELIENLETIIESIASDYNLDKKILQSKYLKIIKKNIKKNNSPSLSLIEIDTSDSSNCDEVDDETNVLEKVEINNKSYWFERKNGGNIFNREVEKVGEYKNGQYLIFDT